MVVNGQPTTCQAETSPKAEAVVKGIMLAVGSFWPLACRFILRGQLATSGVKCYFLSYILFVEERVFFSDAIP